MRRGQLTVLQGTLVLTVEGQLLEAFIHACVKQGCTFSDITYLNGRKVKVTVLLQDWPVLRRLRKNYRCKIKILTKKGAPFFLNRLRSRKALVTAVLIGFIAAFLLANTLWSIKITGLDPELEAEVESKLSSYGIQPGSSTFSMKQPREIQRLLLEDIPELLWVGVKKQGTSYQLYGVKQTNFDEADKPKPSNIVAAKKGLITKMFISKGRPTAEVNEVVKKGKLLATGELKEDSGEFIEAEGEVLAETWYRVEVDSELEREQNITDGDADHSFSIAINDFSIPVWGFWRKYEEQVRMESYNHSLELFGWKVPVQLRESLIYNNEEQQQSLSSDQSVNNSVETAKQSLLLQLDEEAEITDEKILHESKDHGKVKLILLVKVEENIAETKYVSQGD
ncbi:sporulation protein YqfD [Halobacillus sp. A5]|uniref:sporulation protein YqfD n=1 Tax=Halobacillus sp. A5 TaxID=2880263 RepID=UPI0020A65E9C|nr:sporulation protein YqfD [Halobacillus sp. A5]MCP3025639.1 sporulation protein YqfD [Halobacillus sp. A5]